MRKKIATIGVVIIMVGVALSLTGFITIDRAPVNDTVCTGPHSGEYISKIIDYSGGDILIIAGSTGTAGLIKYNDISNATSGNLSTMAVKYTKQFSSGIEYKNLQINIPERNPRVYDVDEFLELYTNILYIINN
jgi:hypothetical protein